MRKKVAVLTSLVAVLILAMVVIAPGAAAKGRRGKALCSGFMWCDGLQGEGIVVASNPDVKGVVFMKINAWAGENLSNETFEGHGSVDFVGFPFGRFTSTAIWPNNNVAYEVQGTGELNGRSVCFFVNYAQSSGEIFFNAWNCQTNAYVESFVGPYRGMMKLHEPWEA